MNKYLYYCIHKEFFFSKLALYGYYVNENGNMKHDFILSFSSYVLESDQRNMLTIFVKEVIGGELIAPRKERLSIV